MVTINAGRAFAGSGNLIRLPTTEALPCSSVGNLSMYKKLYNWVALNTFLLLPFITKAVVLE